MTTTEVDPRRSVHFLTLTDTTGIEGWDPDRVPDRFVTGIGHHLLEPYARLRMRGRPVTIGAVPPPGTRTLVTSMQEIVAWDGPRRRRASWRLDRATLRVPAVVMVMGDHPRPDRVPRFVRAVIVPNPSSVVGPRTRWVPLPPQRAMVRRQPQRRGHVAVMALKTGTPNVPDELRDPAFVAALADLGVELRLDERSPRWPDFEDVDLVLCMRKTHPAWDDDDTFARKPPTKLVNAWVAGCIPLVHPDVGYLDLVEPDADAIVVRNPREILEAVQRLRTDPALVARLESGVARRGAEFTMDRVLDQWERELWHGDHAVTSRAAVAVDCVTLVGSVADDRWQRTVHRLGRRGLGTPADRTPGAA